MKLEKKYSPQKIEAKIYRFWEKGKYFQAKIVKNKKPFVITLPPPNVTGALHIGHGMCSVEDVFARYWRLQKKPVLFFPGFDHASIAVEYLVSKQLKKEGKTKEEIGKKEFLKRARAFARQSRKRIREQFKKLGFSLDWSREAYTMDKIRSQAVKEAFFRLYKKGLIYKGEYIVNWCPGCKSAISDLENKYKEEKGKLYYLNYKTIVVATSRPETIFADVAVAVNPKDKRYKNLVGKKAIIPLINREIPIIADELVDPQFGTGALKITPAHDKMDFEIGQKHHLEKPIGIDKEGKLTSIAGKYQGLSVVEARKKVVKDLKAKGLLIKVEKYQHKIGHCDRCGTVTEPLLSLQWFVKTTPLAKRAIKAVKEGKIKIVPKRFEKIYFHWLTNIKDWCISRQLWWGHKIPLKGEKDVLDTWFSSALWPISVFGWPQKTKELSYFYPTTLRETGYDILFFWVAREIMMCLEMTKKIPYRIIYLHGLVRDKYGEKMSKTKGNVIDPLEVIERYGADVLRMALIIGNSPGNDLRLSEEKIITYRNFANKIWNAARFVLMDYSPKIKIKKKTKHPDDRWILKELKIVAKKSSHLIENYRPDLAAQELYQFFWHKFCDKYIEATKNRKEEALFTLLNVLKASLIMLHPFMPFITEALYQQLPLKNKKSIMEEKWPK